MKVLKKAVQKNVIVDKNYYTESELARMLAEGTITQFDGSEEYRVYTADCTELKIELDEYGFYRSVAILQDGLKLFISL